MWTSGAIVLMIPACRSALIVKYDGTSSAAGRHLSSRVWGAVEETQHKKPSKLHYDILPANVSGGNTGDGRWSYALSPRGVLTDR